LEVTHSILHLHNKHIDELGEFRGIEAPAARENGQQEIFLSIAIHIGDKKNWRFLSSF
jgi:hypothetical protein